MSGRGREAEAEVAVGVAVDAHVGVVDVGEEAEGALAARGQEGAEERVAELKFDVLPVGAAKVPVESMPLATVGMRARA